MAADRLGGGEFSRIERRLAFPGGGEHRAQRRVGALDERLHVQVAEARGRRAHGFHRPLISRRLRDPGLPAFQPGERRSDRHRAEPEDQELPRQREGRGDREQARAGGTLEKGRAILFRATPAGRARRAGGEDVHKGPRLGRVAHIHGEQRGRRRFLRAPIRHHPQLRSERRAQVRPLQPLLGQRLFHRREHRQVAAKQPGGFRHLDLRRQGHAVVEESLRRTEGQRVARQRHLRRAAGREQIDRVPHLGSLQLRPPGHRLHPLQLRELLRVHGLTAGHEQRLHPVRQRPELRKDQRVAVRRQRGRRLFENLARPERIRRPVGQRRRVERLVQQRHVIRHQIPVALKRLRDHRIPIRERLHLRRPVRGEVRLPRRPGRLQHRPRLRQQRHRLLFASEESAPGDPFRRRPVDRSHRHKHLPRGQPHQLRQLLVQRLHQPRLRPRLLQKLFHLRLREHLRQPRLWPAQRRPRHIRHSHEKQRLPRHQQRRRHVRADGLFINNERRRGHGDQHDERDEEFFHATANERGNRAGAMER